MTSWDGVLLFVGIVFLVGLVGLVGLAVGGPGNYQFIQVPGDGLYRCDTKVGSCEAIYLDGRDADGQ